MVPSKDQMLYSLEWFFFFFYVLKFEGFGMRSEILLNTKMIWLWVVEKTETAFANVFQKVT